MKLWREFLIIVLIFGCIWLVFTWQTPSLPSTSFEIGEEREKDLAELIMKDLKREYTFYDDSVSDALLLPIAERLLDSLNPKSYEYKFHLIESSHVNAFATIDGHIFVFSGLIRFIDHPEELAGVLAHEIGHHENGDLVDRLVKELGLSVIMAVLTGGDAVMVSEISKLLISSGFDRKQEREADEFAYELLIKSQIKPARIAHFFTKLKAEQQTYPDELEIIMTHPNSKNRIEDALTIELPEDFKEKEFDLDWDERVKRHLGYSPESVD